MISPNELRIGNIVFHFVESVIIDAIDSDGTLNILSDSTGNISSNCELAQPIPLTDEWLLKFGFTLYENKNYVFRGFTIDWDTKCFVIKLMGSTWTTGRSILYVHQLQNLYFALTGEELTVKELV